MTPSTEGNGHFLTQDLGELVGDAPTLSETNSKNMKKHIQVPNSKPQVFDNNSAPTLTMIEPQVTHEVASCDSPLSANCSQPQDEDSSVPEEANDDGDNDSDFATSSDSSFDSDDDSDLSSEEFDNDAADHLEESSAIAPQTTYNTSFSTLPKLP